ITLAHLDFTAKNRIDVKFKAGTGVRSRGGALVLVPGKAVGVPRTAGLAQVNALLAATRQHVVQRMVSAPGADVEAQKAQLEKATGEELPDMNLWFEVFVDVPTNADFVALINKLVALDIIEYAAAAPLPAPPPTANLKLRQTFASLAAKNERV